MIQLKVLLISGKAQHGKDTVASMLRDKLTDDGKRVLLTHYADLVKYICRNYFGWDGNKDEAGRHLLQYVGADVIRNQNPSFWVDFVAMMLTYSQENWDVAIIPDARFPNEITRMIDSGFDVTHIRVIRPNFKSQLTEEQLNHTSETALDNVIPDYYINNSGDIEELRTTISNWIKENLYEN